MKKTTVYLPDELDIKLDAAAASAGVSKAELIRRGIAAVVERTAPREKAPLPLFHSGRPLTPAEMDEEIYQQIQQRANRR
ncbi:CopG family transcriptional regulator [Nocardia sp. NPDC058658]|uniref:ribbon-helix-helix domain-containing protein n=1 Tax=Nocardia sp. NPDC058658 TaxID=3346580 RepID=UPI00365349EA